MSSLLSFHDFRFAAKGPALTCSIAPGQIMAVVGPAGSGKTRFLRSACGLERAYKGGVRLGGEIVLSGHPALPKRSTPESLARKSAARGSASQVAEALAATHLWESRHSSVASLTPGQQAACELLGPLSSQAPVILVDGQLERLDPWTRASVLEQLERRAIEGAALIIATSLTALLPKSDLLVIWKSGAPIYSGSYADLEKRHGRSRIEIETTNDLAARALCDSFGIKTTIENGAISFHAMEGQELAAGLLLEGYGDVKLVLDRPPTPEELLESLR